MRSHIRFREMDVMLDNKAYKFRIYPNEEQKILISKTIGCSRFVFNHFLAKWNETYKTTGKGLTYHACAKQLPALKKQEKTIWLKEVDSIALQSSVRYLADSFLTAFSRNRIKHHDLNPKIIMCNLIRQSTQTKTLLLLETR